jgi:hypothetical protein
MPTILATQEEEIRRITVPIFHKNRAGGVAQGKGPEFNPQYCKKKKCAEVHGMTMSCNNIMRTKDPR